MQVSDPNNIKIYNLSAGKSLPEWLSERKRRALQKKNVDIRRRIELIQDFEMPGLSTNVKITKNGQYVIATGVYKPRVRCYDVENLSMKFERCFDSEVVAFQPISDDYTKLVFLQSDRYIEFHAAGGRYYRLRIPKFGHDLQYHYATCDLYLVGASSEIYRLNLERGQFLNPFVSEGSELNRVIVNDYHHLVAVGTKEGKVEAWDPRARSKVGTLDCALSCTVPLSDGFPSVTALEFNGPLHLGVGLATGQVVLYDIRSSKSLRVKDHMYGLPIRSISYNQENVLSMDSSVVKIWNKDTGTLFTSIEAGSTTQFNELCVVPNTGLMFIANENVKIQTYYIPAMGPAPKWCSFLDNLTEELEESAMETIYDDYKFVTKKDLEELGLSHLMGTNLLRAYMHGFFIDIRLYRKARSLTEPFAFEEYRRKKIRQKIEEQRTNRVQITKLPKVNQDLAIKLMDKANSEKKKQQKTGSDLLGDDRFKALFENPDFQVDTSAEEYRLLNPVVSRLDKTRKKEIKKKIQQDEQNEEDDEEDGVPSSDENSEDSSSDDDQEWAKEVKKQHRLLKKERRQRELEEEESEEMRQTDQTPVHQRLTASTQFVEHSGDNYKGLHDIKHSKQNKMSLGERLQQEGRNNIRLLSTGNREMTFSLKSKDRRLRAKQEAVKHHMERQELMRRAPRGLAKPKFFSGKKHFSKRK
ncbi:nucleolar protein 10 lethal (2) 34Fd [Lycorma delicatula]|uniref:nucleolar protein 10 lethal (2) 34Fd n=1 Tax=Lycorma delicatula TaxID=130591 RepID=UPI003F50E956